MAEVTLTKLNKFFDTTHVVKDVDLQIRDKEFMVFVGPSGCGKTTALRIVAGFERPTSGRVVVDGNDVTNVPANKRDMGMVFQAYSLFPNMTAQDNIEFGLRIRRQSGTDRRKRVDDLLELVGDRLQSGQRRSKQQHYQSRKREANHGTRYLPVDN